MKTEIFEGKDGKHYFRFHNDDGKQLLRSEGYNSKASAKNGIDSVKRNMSERGKKAVDAKENAGGKHYFNVMSTNGQVVATSTPFSTEKEMNDAVKYLSKNS